MSWTRPKTWQAGEVAIAVDLNGLSNGIREAQDAIDGITKKSAASAPAPSVAALVAAGLTAAASTRPLHRRSLLGLGLFRKGTCDV